MRKEQFKELIEKYNQTIIEILEENFETIKSQQDMDNIMKEASQKWEESMIDGQKAKSYFLALDDEQDIEMVFELISEICDGPIPNSFIKVLNRGSHYDVMAKKAFQNQSFDQKILALKLLGKMGSVENISPMITLLYQVDESDELIKETIREALVDMGSEAVKPIMDHLNKESYLTDDDYYLIMALSYIGNQYPQSDIYQYLKKIFLKDGNKAMASACLGDYGDAKAITVLRAYLQEHVDDLENETIYEIKNAAEKLGGNVDDLIAEKIKEEKTRLN